MQPLRDLVFVEPHSRKKDLTKGEILLPDYAQNVLPDRGVVKAVGPAVRDVRVGQRGIFDRFRADNLKDRGRQVKDWLVMPESLILATIE